MKTFRPTSPSTRQKTVASFTDLEKSPPPRALVESTKNRTGGRNNFGHITSRFRGGGHKRKLRKISFLREHHGIIATVAGIYYDPNRSARIALLNYANGAKAFILAPVGLKKGDKIETGPEADIRIGNALPLMNIPAGTDIHCIELNPGNGARIVRSAGVAAQLLGREGIYAQVKLPSGEVRLVNFHCYATIGQVGNTEHEGVVYGKAGRTRWTGMRPHNRGTTMNPVDHPHGGGEGRTTGGRHPVTPWGKPTKGYKTRNNKRTDSLIIKGRPRGKQTGSK
jgi:large subunit ribosomal protein L2